MYFKYIWATSWQNQRNGMCAQQRLRSAWASAQSYQSLRCLHEETLGPWLSLECTVKTLIRLGGCPGQSESSLGAQIILLVLSWGGSFSILLLFCLGVLKPIIWSTLNKNVDDFSLKYLFYFWPRPCWSSPKMARTDWKLWGNMVVFMVDMIRRGRMIDLCHYMRWVRFLNEQEHNVTNKMTWAPSEDLD